MSLENEDLKELLEPEVLDKEVIHLQRIVKTEGSGCEY